MVRHGELVFRIIAPGGEANLGEAQVEEAEDGRGVFLGLETGVGAERVGGAPETFLERGVVRVFSAGAIHCIGYRE